MLSRLKATAGAASRSRSLSSTLGRDRDARAVRRCAGLMGFSGLRFGLLGVFESCRVVFLAVKLGGSALAGTRV